MQGRPLFVGKQWECTVALQYISHDRVANVFRLSLPITRLPISKANMPTVIVSVNDRVDITSIEFRFRTNTDENYWIDILTPTMCVFYVRSSMLCLC